MDVCVDIGGDGTGLTLEEPADLKSLRVLVRGEGDEREVAAALAPIGRLDADGAHAFLEVEPLAGLAGDLATDPGWRAEYEGMVAYAASKGWTDDDGRLQAHVEREPGVTSE